MAYSGKGVPTRTDARGAACCQKPCAPFPLVPPLMALPISTQAPTGNCPAAATSAGSLRRRSTARSSSAYSCNFRPPLAPAGSMPPSTLSCASSRRRGSKFLTSSPCSTATISSSLRPSKNLLAGRLTISPWTSAAWLPGKIVFICSGNGGATGNLPGASMISCSARKTRLNHQGLCGLKASALARRAGPPTPWRYPIPAGIGPPLVM